MSTAISFFIVLIMLGVNGLFYYGAYICFVSVMDKENDTNYRLFNACYFLASFGLAGAISVGVLALVTF